MSAIKCEFIKCELLSTNSNPSLARKRKSICAAQSADHLFWWQLLKMPLRQFAMWLMTTVGKREGRGWTAKRARVAIRQLEALRQTHTSVIQCWQKINVINFNYIFIMTTATTTTTRSLDEYDACPCPSHSPFAQIMLILLGQPARATGTGSWESKKLKEKKYKVKVEKSISKVRNVFVSLTQRWNIISLCCIDRPTSCMPIKLPFNFNCCCHTVVAATLNRGCQIHRINQAEYI